MNAKDNIPNYKSTNKSKKKQLKHQLTKIITYV